MVDPWTVVLALVVVATIAVYYYMRKSWKYFDDRGIPHANQYPIFTTFWELFVKKKTFVEMFHENYKLEPDAKYVGFHDFGMPMIMVRDLELLKSIMIKNIEHFQDHRSIQAEEVEPIFGKNLFALRGERWKEVRNLLSPAFTSSKMKAMFKLMQECAKKYGDYFAALPEKDKSIELKDAFTRYTNDVIATCAFGVNVDSVNDRQNKFYNYGRTATKFGKWQTFKFFLLGSAPRLFKLTGMKLFDPKVTKFFTDLIKDTISTRDEKGIVRPDMIQLMMETRGKMGPGKELTIEDMTAQAFIFFFGGFESSSTLMCFATYEIGVNPDIQEKLQEEIDEVLEKCNGEVTYEAINEMKYLDAIINEALRMYPVIVASDRTCTKPFELPPAKPGLKPYVMQKDEAIWIPIYGIQYDSQYYDEPTKFKPERFMDDPKKILNSGMFLTFGLGPRMCIGNRFALLETKVLLFNLFSRCNLKPNARTTIPMVLSRDTFQMTAKDGFWFDVEPRKTAVPVLVNSVSNGSISHYEAVVMIDLWTMLLTLVVVATIAVYYKLRRLCRFFDDRGIPHSNQYPFFSSLWTLFGKKTDVGELVNELYQTKPESKYAGIYVFATPMVMIRDLELIKSVLIKNIEHFPDHRTFQLDEVEPLFGRNLFSLRGERWKEVRTMLSPAFTSSKMKTMFKLMRECANKYGEHFSTMPQEGKAIDLQDVFTRYTNDVIATCAFGVNVDSIADRNNKFYTYGKSTTEFAKWQTIKFFLIRSSPWISKLTGLKVFDTKITKFFMDLIEDTIKTRDEKRIVRPDMIQLMMETRSKMGPGKELSILDMTAQAFIFFFGGFRSSSTLMCFAAYEVGVNPEIQRRLQEEIDDVLEKSNGEVTYEAINDMKYLDAIIHEALRMYPVIVFTDRACTKPFELPPAMPGLKPYVVQKGEYVWIPIYGIQHDPQYFEEPYKFKPERFLDDPKKIMNSGMFLTFGLGPRMCIGNRFALLETKILLFNLFARCNLKPNAKTTIPMELSKETIQMTAKGGFWFDIEPRKNVPSSLVNSVSSDSVH
ncbi:uncharacterized protein LOC144468453 [Augochlora pura]